MHSISFAAINMLFLLWDTASTGHQAEVRVHVADPFDDIGIGNASVSMISLKGSQRSTTDASGTAIFARVPEGKYDIRIEASGYRVWLLRNYNVASTQNSPLQATLSIKSSACAFEIKPDYEGVEATRALVRGTVVDADLRKGIRGAKITFLRLNGSEPAITAHSGKNGSFEMPEINPGHYKLQVTKHSFRETDIDLVVSSQYLTAVELHLDARGHVHVCQ